MTGINAKVLENKDYLLKVRRHIHENPELSLQEYETSKFIQRKLDELGIPYQVIEGRSIIATITGGVPGKTVGIRGDIDALPVQEKTDLPFASKVPGVSHACGHDCHGAMVLTAGKILNEMKAELKGTVKLIFQEGEELLAGALNIIKTDLIDDCDNIIGIHVSSSDDTGKFFTGYGPRSAKGGKGVIKVHGQGGHSSIPHKAINAVAIACQIVNAINLAVAYEFDRQESVVFVPTIIEGGYKDNIIPGDATITYNARCFEDKYDTVIAEMLQRVAENTAKAYGATVEIEYTPMGKAVVNEEASVNRGIGVIHEMLGEDALVMKGAMMGGEDFAYLQTKAPGAFFTFGTAKDGKYTPAHSEYTMQDEDALPFGVEFFVRYVQKYLSE